jgi:YesN/AraC family two-component response regulator
MANLHNIFIQYNSLISLSNNRLIRLRKAKQAVQDSIKNHFREDSRFPVPKFYIQGSYKMNTLIVKKDNTYDVDLGVYFEYLPKIEPMLLQKHIQRSINYHTSAGAVHREKCVRVIYQGEFNIDLPVFYLDKNANIPYLATKNGWKKSDPKELVEWYQKNNGNNQQLQRIIKYLKAWTDHCRYKMPSGIALSVWVIRHYVPNYREDLALLNTLKKIKSSFWWSIKCINPALPGDDLVENLTDVQKDRFEEQFTCLIGDIEEALNDNDMSRARFELATHFGKRFIQ